MVVCCHWQGAYAYAPFTHVILGYCVGGRMVFVAGIEGLWSVGGNGLVSVADDSVLRGVAVDTAWRGVGCVC